MMMIDKTTRPKLIMLAGIPTSGKSTYTRQLLADRHKPPSHRVDCVLSTDTYIEKWAAQRGLTYNVAFDKAIDEATTALNLDLIKAVKARWNIVWDQTNLTAKSRKRKLGKIPPSYDRTIVWFDVSLEEALARNENRPGKFISKSIIRRMSEIFEPPTMPEGWDTIIKAL